MSLRRPFVDSAELLPPGPLRHAYKVVRPLFDRISKLDRINGIYRQLQRPEMTPQLFCEEGLKLVGATFLLPADEELAPLRAWQGPLVIMANHPFGGRESLVLMLLLERIRPGGWRLFSNEVLSRTPELAPLLIAVDPFIKSNPANRKGMVQARRFLGEGGLLAAFPGGRVAGWDAPYQQVLDTPWSDHPARLAAATGAAVALIHFPGHNSELFLKVPLRWPRFRAMFLAREMLQPDKPPVQCRIGPVLDPPTVAGLVKAGNAGAKFRARCHLVSEQVAGSAAEIPSAMPPVDSPGDSALMQAEVDKLGHSPSLLFEQGKFRILLFQKHEAPHLFYELARLREITFRASSQGSGRPLDITPEDDYYHQLVMWDSTQQRLAGAYRLGFTREVMREHGQDAIYLNHVFLMEAAFFERLGPAIELTRSFLHPDYQREPLALALLWRGLGHVVAAHPEIKCLFGSVTISAAISPASRAVLVEHLRRHHSDDPSLRSLVKPRAAFMAPGISQHLLADAHAGDPIESLRDTIRSADGTVCAIPPLIRHYLALNARFIDYHVEKDFGDALYCLLRVDLTKVPRPHLRRFTGDEAADRLLGS